jgi:hypothetical protein
LGITTSQGHATSSQGAADSVSGGMATGMASQISTHEGILTKGRNLTDGDEKVVYTK